MLVKLSVEYGAGSDTFDGIDVFADVEPVLGHIHALYKPWNIVRYIQWRMHGKWVIRYDYGYKGKSMLLIDLNNKQIQRRLLNQLNIYP